MLWKIACISLVLSIIHISSIVFHPSVSIPAGRYLLAPPAKLFLVNSDVHLHPALQAFFEQSNHQTWGIQWIHSDGCHCLPPNYIHAQWRDGKFIGLDKQLACDGMELYHLCARNNDSCQYIFQSLQCCLWDMDQKETYQVLFQKDCFAQNRSDKVKIGHSHIKHHRGITH
jgi:hypothetical protein